MAGFIEDFQKGIVHGSAGKTRIDSLPWNAHPAFKGVALKHLITGKDTQVKV